MTQIAIILSCVFLPANVNSHVLSQLPIHSYLFSVKPESTVIKETRASILPDKPAWLDVTLKSGEHIEGFVRLDSQHGFLSILSYQENRLRRLDWIQSSIIESWTPISPHPQAMKIQSKPFVFPLIVHIRLRNGEIIQGWMDSFENQSYFEIYREDNKKKEQIQFDEIAHAVLIESSHAQNSEKILNDHRTSLITDSDDLIRKTYYTTIPLGEKQTPFLTLPPLGATVTVETSIGQRFHGVLCGFEENWAEFKADRIGPYQFTPSHLLLIHRSNIRSIERENAER